MYDDPAWFQEQFENLRDEVNSYDFNDYSIEMPEDHEKECTSNHWSTTEENL